MPIIKTLLTSLLTVGLMLATGATQTPTASAEAEKETTMSGPAKRQPEAPLAPLTPVPLKNVRIEGGFWAGKMETNRRITLPIEYEQCKNTGRIDAWKLEWKPGDPNPPHIFWDSDLAKWLEAVGYALCAGPDPELERKADEVIGWMEKAQQKDGYLNVHYIVVEPGKRWTNLRDCHELYCAGHLMEAAVAYFEATGKRKFLDVMCRYADHIVTVFGPGPDQKHGFPGHEEIELALMKLHRATGEKRYLSLAKYFIDERGRQPHYYDIEAKARGEKPDGNPERYSYAQAHKPLRDQDEVVGHAVRAMYVYTGMTDVAAATGDRELLEASKRLWANLTQRRMHVTGGLGPTHANEGFTRDYDLPNEGAYLETCAAIGLVFWAQRLTLAEADGQYADVMERALYNGTISGVSLEGKNFFYGNPLAVQPDFDGNGRYAGKGYHYRRSEWFGCSCCPPNIARMIAQFPAFLYSTGSNTVFANHYAESAADVEVGGKSVRIVQKTDYPWDEKVAVTIAKAEPAEWTLALRIPGWCQGARLRVNGKAVKVAAVTKKGYAYLEREWRQGDRVELTLPMPPQRIEANPKARQDCGRIALQRGPVVYCLEEVDNGPDLDGIALPRDAKLAVEKDKTILGGLPLITAKAKRDRPEDWEDTLYRPAGSKTRTVTLRAIPYFAWANRQPGQ